MSSMHRGFRVKQHNPWKFWFGLLIVAMLLAMAFFAGQMQQALVLKGLKFERETFLLRIADLESMNEKLLRENAHLAGNSKVERDAYQLANQELVRLQQELLSQKEELAFYRGIVSPNDAVLGVNLQTFELRRKNSQNQYSYKIILTRSGKSNKKMQGSVSVLIRGEGSEGIGELKMTDLRLEDPGIDTKFSFRYFQVFDGDIALPGDFEPFEVAISIKPSSKKLKSLTEIIMWSDVLKEGV